MGDGTDASESFLSRIQGGNSKQVYAFMRRYKIQPHLIRDGKGFTALHISALNNNHNLINIMIRYVTEIAGEDELRDWLETKTYDEEFTALHFAAFRGNHVVLKALVLAGADYSTSNKSGMQAVHLAAQGDKPVILAYLREVLKVQLNEVDYKGNSPLHWAAFLGCETVVSVLLAFGSDVLLQNKEGQTPLHLAVLSENVRVIRALLYKGASRSITNDEGKTALALAQEHRFEQFYSMLTSTSVWAQFGCTVALKPYKNTYISLINYFFLFIGLNTLNAIIILPHTGYIPTLAYLAAFGASIFFFLNVMCRDPGYVKNEDGKTLLSLLEVYDPSYICPDWVILRPFRSRHCQCCGKWVEKFDHHCPWVNNCIGAKNLGFFYMFLICTYCQLWIGLAVNVFYLIGFTYGGSAFYAPLISLSSTVTFVVDIVFLVVIAFFLFLLSILLFVQSWNFCGNKTTNERCSRGAAVELDDDASNVTLSSSARIDRSSWARNCFSMCFNTEHIPMEDISLSSTSGSEEVRYSILREDYQSSLLV